MCLTSQLLFVSHSDCDEIKLHYTSSLSVCLSLHLSVSVMFSDGLFWWLSLVDDKCDLCVVALLGSLLLLLLLLLSQLLSIVNLLFSYSATQPQVWNETKCQCQWTCDLIIPGVAVMNVVAVTMDDAYVCICVLSFAVIVCCWFCHHWIMHQCLLWSVVTRQRRRSGITHRWRLLFIPSVSTSHISSSSPWNYQWYFYCQTKHCTILDHTHSSFSMVSCCSSCIFNIFMYAKQWTLCHFSRMTPTVAIWVYSYNFYKASYAWPD